ncbi:MAG TPA: hypothetical protein VH142_24320 [Polyangiaceae bacterium]|jgi:ELWxxDGT repeat protein|nr:hypothetical protein [Polyangiaceae bacterium]
MIKPTGDPDTGEVGFSKLWRTDFTGTTVTDVTPVADAAVEGAVHVTALGQQVLFTMTKGNETTLWVIADPSSSATQIGPTFPGVYWSSTHSDDLLYFIAGNADSIGYAIWRTDGTDAGTFEVWSGDSSPNAVFASGSTLSFLVETAPNFTWALWHSDGTQAGTVSLGKSFATTYFGANIGNKTCFVGAPTDPSSARVWVTDGTVEGTRPALANPSGSSAESVYAASG